MNASVRALVVAFTGLIILGAQAPAGSHGASAGQGPQTSTSRTQVNDTRTTKEEFDRWMTQLSNWGRWGKDDELGAANLITPAKRKQAAQLVKAGTTVSLARSVVPLNKPGPIGQSNPLGQDFVINDERQYVTELQQVYFHGTVYTHLDALCHVAYGDKIYNGLSFKEAVTKDGGCAKMGVLALKDGIVTRGILLDIPRLKGIPYLPTGTHVYREDIEAWEKKAGVKISPGDAVFLRTGRRPDGFGLTAGWDASVAPLFKERDVAIVGADVAQDVGTLPDVYLPIHRFVLVALGATLIDNADLEPLAETAARLNRWDFLLAVAPTPVVKATGSIINPIAVF